MPPRRKAAAAAADDAGAPAAAAAAAASTTTEDYGKMKVAELRAKVCAAGGFGQSLLVCAPPPRSSIDTLGSQ